MKKFLILTIILFSLACNTIENESGPKNKVKKEIPDQEAWDFVLENTNQEKTDVILRAGHMTQFTRREVSFFDQGVVVDFFNVDGTAASRLTSEKGEYYERSQLVVAIGNVVVKTDSGQTLYTEKISFDQRNEKIFSKEDVMMVRSEGDTIWGTGFKSDPKLDNIEIFNVRMKGHKGFDLDFKQSSADSVVADSLERTNLDSLSTKDSTLTQESKQ